MPDYTGRLLAAFKSEQQPVLAVLDQDGRESGQPRRISEGPSSPAAQPFIEPLSHRELEILRLFKTDLSGPEIAAELVIALSTVRTHTKSIFSKLDVNNRRAAVKRAAELGLM